jgi:4-azaleucine resistance transporter AzlC
VSSPSPAGSEAELTLLNRHLIWLGFRQMIPLALFVMLFGAAFGLAATQAGLPQTRAVVTSMVVFAGAAQFGALELWGPQVPLLTLALTVFAINARHLLMGASLYPWLRHLPPARRFGLMTLASDSNWALTMQALARGQPGLGLLLGGGIALWVFWALGTWLGAAFGGVVSDPRRWGLDMVMGCFFLAIVLGGPRDRRMLAAWTAAAGASLLAHQFLPENSHVVVGALAGGLAGAFWKETRHEH